MAKEKLPIYGEEATHIFPQWLKQLREEGLIERGFKTSSIYGGNDRSDVGESRKRLLQRVDRITAGEEIPTMDIIETLIELIPFKDPDTEEDRFIDMASAYMRHCKALVPKEEVEETPEKNGPFSLKLDDVRAGILAGKYPDFVAAFADLRKTQEAGENTASYRKSFTSKRRVNDLGREMLIDIAVKMGGSTESPQILFMILRMFEGKIAVTDRTHKKALFGGLIRRPLGLTEEGDDKVLETWLGLPPPTANKHLSASKDSDGQSR